MKRLIYALSFGLALFGAAASARADAGWDEVLAKARGQTVYWNAWGGDERTNSFIAWVGAEVQRRYGVELRQVKLTDTGEAVARVVAEKSAGRDADGSVDMIWINGPNFLSMKEKGLLYGPFAQKLPNAIYVDTTNKPSNVTDFTIPVDGMESPWRLAQFVFIDNSAHVAMAPRTLGDPRSGSKHIPAASPTPIPRISWARAFSSRSWSISRRIPSASPRRRVTRSSPPRRRRCGPGTMRSGRRSGVTANNFPPTARRSCSY